MAFSVVPNTITLFKAFDWNDLDKYPYGRELNFESYNSEGVMRSIVSSKSAPSNDSEKIPSQLPIVKWRKLHLLLCTVLIKAKEEASEPEYDDINYANEMNEDSNEQGVYIGTITNFLINISENKKIRK